MIEKRCLQENELEAWFSHCQSIFQLEDPLYFQKHYRLDPAADATLIFVALHEGEIVSSVRVFDRTVWIRGQAVHCGGVGEVSTQPAFQRQGLASALLQMALDEMVRRHMQVSILFGKRPFYRHMGWHPVPVAKRKADVRQLPLLKTEQVTIRPFHIQDLLILQGIYDLYAGRFDGAILRSEAYWQQWVLGQWHMPYVLLQEDRPAAYCCANTSGKDGVLHVCELCAVPQAERLLPHLVASIAHLHACETIFFSMSFLPGLSGEKTDTGSMMIRINDPQFFAGSTASFVETFMQNPGMFAVDRF